MTNERYDVLVIGAGAAGLAAARVLAEAGRSVLVLEGRERIGGRIFTVMDGAEPIELGPEFVHGRPPVSLGFIEEAKLETYELDGEHICSDEKKVCACDAEFGSSFEYLEELEKWKGADVSFTAWLAQADVPQSAQTMLTGYVEGFNAADKDVIGVYGLARQQEAEDKIEGDRLFRIRAGYSALPEFLAGKVRDAGGRIALESVVDAVEWKRGSVAVSARVRGEAVIFHAKQCVVTLPLGVLQSGTVRFTPSPEKIFAAAAQMRMGPVRRFTLVFHTAFWKEIAGLAEMSFLHSNGFPRTWWTQYPEDKNYIVGWSGGPRSAHFEGRSEEEIGEEACVSLAAALHVDVAVVREQLLHCHSHDWQSDPFARGAYSYVPAGAIDAPVTMTEPVEQTLFFAGEHTDPSGHWGTVHGALSSGLRAAAQILEAEK